MIDDIQIIEAAQRAERIKAAMPSLCVSNDAIFIAIVLGKRRPGRPSAKLKALIPREPPEWFAEALTSLKGKALTIGEFMMWSKRIPATRPEKVAVGRWLRASGRHPIKRGGKQVFNI
ncbi:MAG: hypothetical protein ACTHL5_11380 [Rhodanobacter sp.]